MSLASTGMKLWAVMRVQVSSTPSLEAMLAGAAPATTQARGALMAEPSALMPGTSPATIPRATASKAPRPGRPQATEGKVAARDRGGPDVKCSVCEADYKKNNKE